MYSTTQKKSIKKHLINKLPAKHNTQQAQENECMYSNSKERKTTDTTTKGKRLKPSKQEHCTPGLYLVQSRLVLFLCSHSPDGESRPLVEARLAHLPRAMGVE